MEGRQHTPVASTLSIIVNSDCAYGRARRGLRRPPSPGSYAPHARTLTEAVRHPPPVRPETAGSQRACTQAACSSWRTSRRACLAPQARNVRDGLPDSVVPGQSTDSVARDPADRPGPPAVRSCRECAPRSTFSIPYPQGVVVLPFTWDGLLVRSSSLPAGVAKPWV